MYKFPVPKIDFVSGHGTAPGRPFNQRDPGIKITAREILINSILMTVVEVEQLHARNRRLCFEAVRFAFNQNKTRQKNACGKSEPLNCIGHKLDFICKDNSFSSLTQRFRKGI